MLGSGLNLVTTVIGFGMSATFIVFICARLICGRIRRLESRAAAFDLELRPDLDPPEHAIRGLEPVDVAAIPTMKYHHKAFHSKEDAQCSICSICLGEYEDKEVLRIMPACLHNFHLTCIDLWLQNNSTCPICRLPLNAIHETRLAFSFANDHFNTWALPTHQHTESSGSSQEISGAVSVVIGIPHGEHVSGT